MGFHKGSVRWGGEWRRYLLQVSSYWLPSPTFSMIFFSVVFCWWINFLYPNVWYEVHACYILQGVC
jgi:hypothetical protein